MTSLSKAPKDSTQEKKITIKFIPDESTKQAMKQFESNAFKKKIEKDMKLLSSHKIFR